MKKMKVFRATSASGDVSFLLTVEGEDGSAGFISLENLVDVLKLQLAKSSITGIDFSPRHDIECRRAESMWRCKPLSPKERALFWKHLTTERQ